MKRIVGFSILGGLVLAGAGLYLYAKNQVELLKNFQYRITNFKLDTMNLQMIKGKIFVLFTSPSDIEVTVDQFILDFYFNGKKVGYLQEDNPFIIPAKGSTTIPLDFTLNPQLVFKNVSDILSYSLKQQDASIHVEGFARLRSGFVKTTLPITYDTTVKEILAD